MPRPLLVVFLAALVGWIPDAGWEVCGAKSCCAPVDDETVRMESSCCAKGCRPPTLGATTRMPLSTPRSDVTPPPFSRVGVPSGAETFELVRRAFASPVPLSQAPSFAPLRL